jgi:hypothetical protein
LYRLILQAMAAIAANNTIHPSHAIQAATKAEATANPAGQQTVTDGWLHVPTAAGQPTIPACALQPCRRFCQTADAKHGRRRNSITKGVRQRIISAVRRRLEVIPVVHASVHSNPLPSLAVLKRCLFGIKHSGFLLLRVEKLLDLALISQPCVARQLLLLTAVCGGCITARMCM